MPRSNVFRLRLAETKPAEDELLTEKCRCTALGIHATSTAIPALSASSYRSEVDLRLVIAVAVARDGECRCYAPLLKLAISIADLDGPAGSGRREGLIAAFSRKGDAKRPRETDVAVSSHWATSSADETDVSLRARAPAKSEARRGSCLGEARLCLLRFGC